MAGTTESRKPTCLLFSIPSTNATARGRLLWDKAPKTCAAVCAQLPIESTTFHGRNSGDEALLCTPKVISTVPQDESENASTEHRKDFLYFGYEPPGFCYGGVEGGGSEIVWIYGDAAQATYWVSEHGPPHDKPPYTRKAALLNCFGSAEEEDGFYATSKKLVKTGELKITVTAGYD